MSARQPFFPKPSGPPVARKDAGSGSLTFTADRTNPLHAGAAGNAQLESQPGSDSSHSRFETIASALAGRSAPSGLGGIRKRKSIPDEGDGSNTETGLLRPGTADPNSSKALQALSRLDRQQGIAQPTPRFPTRASSTILSAKHRSSLNTAFKVPGSIEDTSSSPVVVVSAATSDQSLSEKNAHISISGSDLAHSVNQTGSRDENESGFSKNTSLSDANEPFVQPSGLNIKFNPSVNKIGPRRVFVEAGTVLGSSGHEVTEDGTVKWNSSLARKRTADQIEDDDEHRYENPAKRQKILPDKATGDSRGNSLELSPIQDRPSSSFSHPIDRRTGHSHVRESPNSHRARPQSRQTPSREEYSPYDIQHSQRPTQHDIPALDSLLRLDTDAFVRGNLEAYDQLVHKWSNCTLAEWSSGADEIASQFCKILDYVKDYVTDKVKLYGDLHGDLDKHNVILNERNRDLSATKKKLIQDSGSFLGR